MTTKKQCIVWYCERPGIMMCKRCHEFYCSERHQISDWHGHKLICIPQPLSVGDLDSTLSKSPISSQLDRSWMKPSRTVLQYCQPLTPYEAPLWTPCIQSKHVPNNMTESSGLINNSRVEHISIYITSQCPHFTVEPRNVVALAQQNVEIIIEPHPKTNIELNPSLSNEKPWQKLFPFRRNELVKVLVQYVNENDPTLVWVMQACLENNSYKLLEEINKAVTPEIRQCTESEMQFGELISAPFDELYYRAIILEEVNPLGEVRIRLVDYGNDLSISINKVKPATPFMKNVNSYAFCIRLRNHKLKIGDSLEIRVICKDDQSYFTETIKKCEEIDTEIKSLPRKNVLKALKLSVAKIKCSNIISSNKALAYISNDIITGEFIKMNTSLITIDQVDKSVFSVPNIGDFVAGKTNCGWKRGIILASNNNEYIMSLCDTGEITFISQFKIIPTEYRLIPTQSIVLELQKTLISETIFRTEFFVMNKNLYIKVGKELDDNKLLATLYAKNNTPLAEVIIYSWSGTLSELNIRYWPIPLLNNENIKITSVINYSKICICPADKLNFYSKKFHEIGINAPAIFPSDAKPNEIVLAPNNTRFVRCLIKNKPNEDNSNLIDLDSGCIFICSDDKLKLANNFIKYCPVYVVPVNLNLHESVEMKTLKEKIFRIKFSGSYGLELIPNDSLNDIQFPVLFEQPKKFKDLKEQGPMLKKLKIHLVEENYFTLKNLEEEQGPLLKKLKIPPVEDNYFTLKDIEVIPIRTGQQVNIFCLDDSLISRGLITACNFDDVQYYVYLESVYADNIAKYCNSPKVEKFYRPKNNEICFSISEADGRWYRAMCIEELPNDNYVLTFLDYGNKASVTSKNIRKFSEDFLHRRIANFCRIDGLPGRSSNEIFTKLKSIIMPNKVVKVDEITFKNDMYVLFIKKLFL